MIKSLLVGLSLFVSFSVQAKELCTLAQIILKPAKNNVCFDRLITQTKNANDRKWLLDLKNNWNPSSNMQIHLIAAGAEFFDGKTFIGSFQWLSMNPPILSINGVMKVGEKSDEKSIVAIVQKLFNEKTTAQFLYQSFVPSADAQDKDSSRIRDLTTLFTLVYSPDPKTAEELFSKRNQDLIRLYMPDIIAEMKHLENVPLQCSSQGVQNVPFQFDDSRKIKISQGKDKQYIVEGIIPNKKLAIAYVPMPNGPGNPCTIITSKEMDEKYCQPGWEVFFKENPKARTKYASIMPSDSVIFDCVAFKPDFELIEKCMNFWERQGEKYEHYVTATALPKPVPNMKVFKCEDSQCDDISELNELQLLDMSLGEEAKQNLIIMRNEEFQKNKTAYIRLLKQKGIKQADDVCTEGNRCILPKLDQLSLKDQNEVKQLFSQFSQSTVNKTAAMTALLKTEFLGHFVTGTKILGECCKNDKCIANAKANYNLQLEKAKATTK